MNSKKAITLLVLATMLMALVPIVPVQGIVTITSYTGKDGGALPAIQKGNTVEVHGTGATPGATVGIYWDSAVKESFTDGTGRLNTTIAKGNGDWVVQFKIPEAVAGSHYVSAKDLSNNAQFTGAALVVLPLLKLSPSSGLPGDTITLTGYGYGSETDVNAITDDFVDGATALEAVETPAAPITTTLGTWTATFQVPTGTDYGTYTISATDNAATPNVDTASFDVGASITLSKNKGPAGSVINISGRGFSGTTGGSITTTGITFDPTGTPIVCYLEAAVAVRADGSFDLTTVIPQPAATGDYDITVLETGGSGYSATAGFEVDGLAKVKATPSYGPQGSTVTVEGWNFTQMSNKDVIVTLDSLGAKTFKTDSNGHFMGAYTVPAVASGPHVDGLKAEQAIYKISATTNFRAGVIIVILSPSSGPAGSAVGLTGTGFSTGGAWNATFGDITWVDVGTPPAASEISETGLYVPSVAPGVYIVSVWDSVAEIEVLVPFTVTATTKASTNPAVAPQNYNVTLSGSYFAQNAGTSLDFVIFNSTDSWPMDVYVGLPASTTKVTVDAEGNFTGWWNFNKEALTLSIGSYMVNITDNENLFVQIPFSVVDKTVEIMPRKAVFRIGETVAFDIESTFAMDDSYIQVWDPSGSLIWRTANFDDNNGYWLNIGLTEVVPYYLQTAGQNLMTLLEDAPLGVYTWEFNYDGDVVSSGTFTVEAAVADVIGEQVADLANQLTDLQDSLADVTSEFDDVKSDIANVAAVAQQAVTAAQQAAQAVQTVAQTANQANTAAQNAADAANAAKDAANSLTTLVYGAIGAALVAALAAIVSLMQISRRIAG